MGGRLSLTKKLHPDGPHIDILPDSKHHKQSVEAGITCIHAVKNAIFKTGTSVVPCDENQVTPEKVDLVSDASECVGRYFIKKI